MSSTVCLSLSLDAWQHSYSGGTNFRPHGKVQSIPKAGSRCIDHLVPIPTKTRKLRKKSMIKEKIDMWKFIISFFLELSLKLALKCHVRRMGVGRLYAIWLPTAVIYLGPLYVIYVPPSMATQRQC